ncbi:MAG: zinc-dependent peptidase [Acidimicrobiia bacterium]|nr:zinc-dependent peptidase [Acidimicrobiia bacterium]
MGWFRDHRRRKILEGPFPAAWDGILESGLAHWRHLDDDEKGLLRDLTQVFVAEKSWEGCGGLEITDEIRVTIAAEACLLLLGLENLDYTDVEAILVYPTAVKTPDAPHASFGSVVESGPLPILGQAARDGPVLLTWDSVTKTARHPERGHNVVYHEFAHKLDMLTGTVDGTPPMASAEQFRRWVEVCTAEYELVQGGTARHRRTFLDTYAGVNVGEFFAVATEYFFDLPREMASQRPDLYDVLRDFYRQDPAAREERSLRHRRDG